MIEYGVSIDIAAPPAVVWRIMSDVERWPEWTASVTRVTLADEGPLKVGSRATIWQPKFPKAFWKVVSVEPGRGFRWVNVAPGSRITANHFVEPQGGGSRASLGLQYEGPFGWLVAKLTRSITYRYLQLEAEGLKQRAEAETNAASQSR